MDRAGPSPLRVVIGGALGVFAIAAIAHAAWGFEAHDHSRLLPPCVFKTLLGIDCPGCGMTRSFILLSQLRVGDAFRAHPAGPILLATMAAYVVAPGCRALETARRAAPACLALVLVLWLARL